MPDAYNTWTSGRKITSARLNEIIAAEGAVNTVGFRPVQSYRYALFLEDGLYYRRDGHDGAVDYSSATATPIITQTLSDMVAGDSLLIESNTTVTSTIALNGNKTIYGLTPETTITISADAPVITHSNNNNTVAHIKLATSYGTPTTGLIAGGGNEHLIVGCYLAGGKYGVHQSSGGYRWRTIGNYFYNQGTSGFYANDSLANYGVVANNIFHAGCVDGAQIHLNNGGHNDVITGNELYVSDGMGIYVEAYALTNLHDVLFAGNFIVDAGKGGIKVASGGSHFSSNYIVNNNITDSVSEVILTGTANYNTFTGNTIYQFKDAAVYCVEILAGATKNNVSYNTLRKQYVAAGYVSDGGTTSNVTGNFEFQA